MDLLLQFPGFNLTPEILRQLNEELAEIDQHREKVLGMLGQRTTNSKRSRYDLDLEDSESKRRA